MFFWNLFSKFGIWIQGSGATGDLFFKSIWKIKERIFKTNWTLSLILRFNLKLRGYSIWSEIFIASHIKDNFLKT
jgi:hypothetical protein